MDAEQAAKPRVVVADDSAEILKLVTRILHSKFIVVGGAQNGRDALSLALELEPDVLILDVAMPQLSGIEVATLLQQKNSRTKVIFLINFDDPDVIQAALSAGGKGFVFKSHMHVHLPRAIRVVLEGWTFFSSEEPS